MKTSSAKSKGRRLASRVRDLFLFWAPDLEPGDINITSSGATGEDLLLSPKAKLFYPYSIECKNQERLSIWEALSQAEKHRKNAGDTTLLIFSRNRAKTYVVVEIEDFLKLTR